MTHSQPKPQCPKCGAKSLRIQPCADGTTELICLELDCDFVERISTAQVDTLTPAEHPTDSFQARLTAADNPALGKMADNLQRAAEELSGRGKRIARRQLAMVNAELRKRKKKHHTDTVTNSDHQRVPPQLNTPQARMKRLRGIRAYHQQRKLHTDVHINGQDETLVVWLSTITETLHQEAERHEQAARHYARVPELFPLHIDHSARAFELNRIHDLLTHYVEIIHTTAED